jgi:hypothetical protein
MASQFSMAGMKALGASEFNITLSYYTIFLTIGLALGYIVIASMGINNFKTCGEDITGSKTNQNLNEFLVASIAIAIAIPAILLFMKLVGHFDMTQKMLVFGILYAVMGVIASAISLNFSMKCKKEEGNGVIWNGIMIAATSAATIGLGYMLYIQRHAAFLAARDANFQREAQLQLEKKLAMMASPQQ